MNHQFYQELISGRKSGICSGLLRGLLGIASIFYSAIIRARNILYDRGVLKSYKAGAVVISVGNITVGGTGKTPLVIWLCKFLEQKELRCAILTRGYKAQTQTRQTSDEQRATSTDEPAILAQSCPEAKVIVNPDRVTAARQAVEKFGAKVLIMDDGFQHRRLARELDIVAIDGTRGFGYTGKLLPAGFLREPVRGLRRADVIVITRCDQVGQDELEQAEETLQKVNPDIIIARSIHNPVCVTSEDGKEMSIEQLKDRKVFAFCGIGNPDAFLNTIKKLNTNLVGSKVYNDHYHYTNNDISDIYQRARALEAELILATQKDWTKIRHLRWPNKDIPVAYLVIEIKFVAGDDKLRKLIKDTLAVKIEKK